MFSEEFTVSFDTRVNYHLACAYILLHCRFEVININTKEKPEWFEKINPSCTVPTVQYNDKIVYESLITAEFLDDSFPGDKKIMPQDPYAKAQQKMLLERLVKVRKSAIPYSFRTTFYSYVFQIGMASWNFYSKKDDPAVIKSVEDALETFEKSLTSDFIAGKSIFLYEFKCQIFIGKFTVIYE